jgi:hypothetical protein
VLLLLQEQVLHDTFANMEDFCMSSLLFLPLDSKLYEEFFGFSSVKFVFFYCVD